MNIIVAAIRWGFIFSIVCLKRLSGLMSCTNSGRFSNLYQKSKNGIQHSTTSITCPEKSRWGPVTFHKCRVRKVTGPLKPSQVYKNNHNCSGCHLLTSCKLWRRQGGNRGARHRDLDSATRQEEGQSQPRSAHEVTEHRHCGWLVQLVRVRRRYLYTHSTFMHVIWNHLLIWMYQPQFTELLITIFPSVSI